MTSSSANVRCRNLKASIKWTLFLGVLTSTAMASPPVRVWSQTSIGSRHSASDAGGNVYFTGGGVTKLFADGSYAWRHNFAPGVFCEDLAAAPDGRVFPVCVFEGTVDLDPSEGKDQVTAEGIYDSAIVEFGPDGEYLGKKVLRSMPESRTFAVQIEVDSEGSVFVAGNFHATDFDPGPGTDIRTRPSDGFVSKFGPDGAYLFTRTFGASAFDTVRQLALDPEGNAILAGEFRLTVDFDWGTGQDRHTAAITSPTFITKISSGGEYRWTRSFQNIPQTGHLLTTDEDSNIWLGGVFAEVWDYQFIDFDPTPGTNVQEALDHPQIFVSKLTPDGEYTGTWFLPSTSHAWLVGVESDVTGGLLLAGELRYYEGLIDLDPGPSENLHAGTNTPFVERLRGNGAFDWSRVLPDQTTIDSMTASPDGRITLAGAFGPGAVDLDPGCAVALHESDDEYGSGYILRLEPATVSPDADGNGATDLRDLAAFDLCFSGPSQGEVAAVCPLGCYNFDADHDDDIDEADYYEVWLQLTGPLVP